MWEDEDYKSGDPFVEHNNGENPFENGEDPFIDDPFLEDDPFIEKAPFSPYQHINGVECIDVIEQMPFNTGNAIKYLWRYLDSGEPITDLQKAIWYIRREILRLTGQP